MNRRLFTLIMVLLLLAGVARAEGEITSQATLNETEHEIGISQGGDVPATGATAESRLAQMNGKRIGVQTGQSFDKAVAEQLPDAQVLYFNSKADTVNALLTEKSTHMS